MLHIPRSGGVPFGAGASALNRCRGFLFIEVLRGFRGGCAVTRRRAGVCPGIHEGARAVSDGRQAFLLPAVLPLGALQEQGRPLRPYGLGAGVLLPCCGVDLRETHNNLLKSACVCLSVVINSFLKSFLNSLCGGFWGILSRRRFWVGTQCAVSRFVVLALAVPLPEI